MIPDHEVPEEEYPFVAFGITWLTEHALEYLKPHRLERPGIAYLDEIPNMDGADYDLVYWWHLSFTRYPELENRARISMLKKSRESKVFNSSQLGKHLDLFGPQQSTPPEKSWIFQASRIGIDIQSRQAIGFFYVNPGNCWLNLGYTLVMGWDESNTIHLIADHPVVAPGK